MTPITHADLIARSKKLRGEMDGSMARIDRQCVTVMFQMEEALAAVFKAKEDAEAELAKIADVTESHWRGAGLPLASEWIIREWLERTRSRDAEIEDLQARLNAMEGQRKFNCWSTNDGDSWLEHPADAQAIYDILGSDPKIGDEYELLAGWTSVRARYRVTEINGDDIEVECVSHPNEKLAPTAPESAGKVEAIAPSAAPKENT